MGTLLPHTGNITYSTAGALSPLLKDPHLRTIGIGTRILPAAEKAMWFLKARRPSTKLSSSKTAMCNTPVIRLR